MLGKAELTAAFPILQENGNCSWQINYTKYLQWRKALGGGRGLQAKPEGEFVSYVNSIIPQVSVLKDWKNALLGAEPAEAHSGLLLFAACVLSNDFSVAVTVLIARCL